MKISGLTIIRNAIINDYPVVEAINSILPVVDEMIISVDPGDDNTENLVRQINSPKIRIVLSAWDLNQRKGGEILATETNKALDQVSPDTDWIFYIQADEVVHEKYLPGIREAAEKYLNDRAVEGLLFNYLHFYGTYDYVGDSRKWYDHETRIIRNDRAIISYRDAQGFRKGNKKLRVASIDAFIYHYGWVKSPQQMKTKQKNVGRFWIEDDKSLSAFLNSGDIFDYSKFDSLQHFQGTHPRVMTERIAAQNWKLDLDISRKKLGWKNGFLYRLEKLTGWRPFSFRNHKIIRRQ